IDFPSARLTGTTACDAESFVEAGKFDGLDHGLVVELDVAIAACGQGVGAHRQAIALAERIAGEALDGLRARAARQPDDPGIGVLLGNRGEAAHGGGCRVPAANDQDVLAGISRAALAEDIFEPIGDLRLDCQLSNGWDAAVSQPAVLAVGARAIEYDV